MKQSGLRGCGAFDLLKLEFVGPLNDRAPDKLIQQNDNGNHGRNAPKNRARVPVAGSCLKKRAESRQAEVAIAQDKHFASHQEKPAARYGDHGIPHESNGGERKVQFTKALPSAEAVNDSRFVEIARNRL